MTARYAFPYRGPSNARRTEVEHMAILAKIDHLTGLAMRHDPDSEEPWRIVAACTALLDGVSADARANMAVIVEENPGIFGEMAMRP